MSGDITIITASGAPYYESMRTYVISSVMEHEPLADIIIWDLGLDESQLQDLKLLTNKHKGKVTICKYPDKSLPAHYSMSKFNYAFKCYCLYQSLFQIRTRYAMWLDTGSQVIEPLHAEKNIIHKFGYYCPLSNHNIVSLTHPVVMNNFMGEKLGFGERTMLYAGMQGWDMKDVKAISLLNEWYQLSRLEENISPIGASLQNHRYDQSLLSLIYYSRYKEIPYACKYCYNVFVQQNKKK